MESPHSHHSFDAQDRGRSSGETAGRKVQVAKEVTLGDRPICHVATERTFLRTELPWIALILLISVVHSVLNVFDLGYAGQDFDQHTRTFSGTRNGVLLFNTSSPPAVYLLGKHVAKWLSPEWMMEGVSIGQVVVNLFVLSGWYWLSRKLITSVPLRLAAFMLVVFLPVRAIHTVVFAADSLTVIPVLLLTVLLVAHVRATSFIGQLVAGLGVGLVWCFGLFTKFTFFVVPAGLGCLYVFWLLRPASPAWRKKFIVSAVISSILPCLFFGWMYGNMKRTGNIWFNSPQRGKGMPISAVIGLKAKDVKIFSAPEFKCAHPMSASEGHSYIALAHLGTFSDVWNFFQTPPAEVWGLPRPLSKCFPRTRTERSTMLTPWSLMLSVPVTLLALMGLVYQGLRGARLSLTAPTLQSDLVTALCVVSVSYCLPSIAGLPFYWPAYEFGYWTPRLVFPSIMGFILLGFVTLDQRIGSKVGWTVLGYSMVLSAIYLLIL